jgi:hypothetical protein
MLFQGRAQVRRIGGNVNRCGLYTVCELYGTVLVQLMEYSASFLVKGHNGPAEINLII